MNQHLQSLTQKEMTRQEFITLMGLGMASILGFSTLIRLLTGKSAGHQLSNRVDLGFGSGAYGGGKEKR